MGAVDRACAAIAEKQSGLISRDKAIQTGMSERRSAEGWARADGIKYCRESIAWREHPASWEQSLPPGDYNTASGFEALRSNTTGNLNTASGANALASNTTGSGNTVSGDASHRIPSAGSVPTRASRRMSSTSSRTRAGRGHADCRCRRRAVGLRTDQPPSR